MGASSRACSVPLRPRSCHCPNFEPRRSLPSRRKAHFHILWPFRRVQDSADLVRGDPPEPGAGETAPSSGKRHRTEASLSRGGNRSRSSSPGGTNALVGGCGAGIANSDSPKGGESGSPPRPMAAGSGNSRRIASSDGHRLFGRRGSLPRQGIPPPGAGLAGKRPP